MTNKEAIAILKYIYFKCDKDQGEHIALDMAIKALEDRPQGKWIYDNTLNNWKCSECGETPKTIGYVGTSLFMEQHFKFCNHCGADMRGDNNE